MAFRAVESGVSAFEREEIVIEVRSRPAGGCMTAFAIRCPAVRNVVGRIGLSQIPLVTQFALNRCSFELTNGRLEMAALTGSHGMCRHEMETSPGVLGDQSCRRPVRLAMTPLTIKTKRRSVRVGMTAAAAAIDVGHNRSSIVMTPQTGCLGVRTFQRIAGLGLMIK